MHGSEKRSTAEGEFGEGSGLGRGGEVSGEISGLMATRFLANQTDLRTVNDSSHIG